MSDPSGSHGMQLNSLQSITLSWPTIWRQLSFAWPMPTTHSVTLPIYCMHYPEKTVGLVTLEDQPP